MITVNEESDLDNNRTPPASDEEHAQRSPVFNIKDLLGSSQATVSTYPQIPTPHKLHKKVLLLGMVKAEEFRTNVMGQEGRDRTRIDAMEKLGWNVYTADDKHPQTQKRLNRVRHKKSTKLIKYETELPQHCDTNFAMRGFFNDIRTRFVPNIKFSTIVLDYFFSPQGYVQDRWLGDFFMRTLPGFVIEDVIDAGACVWIPCIDHTANKVQEYRHEIEQVYVIDYVSDPNMNPLFYATGLEETYARLLLFPEKLVNDNQLVSLNSKTPFIRLTSKGKCTHAVASVSFIPKGTAAASAVEHSSSCDERNSNSTCAFKTPRNEVKPARRSTRILETEEAMADLWLLS